MSVSQRVSYLLRQVMNTGQRKVCPFCKQTDFSVIDRKYIFTTLIQCKNCGLSHRHPKDDEQWLRKFYQSEYSIDTHMMTKIPSDDEIRKLKESNFPNLRSYDKYIDALFKKPLKIIDYGCSWGYNVYKLVQSGYQAVGYELSVPRAQLGMSKLNIQIYSDTDQLPGENDVIMSSHVIEHLSDINELVALSKRLLKESGVFMAFCPNGNKEYRNREPEVWHVNWGAVHPNYLDVNFAKHMFRNNPYLILTGDWDFNPEDILKWDGRSQVVGPKADGKELFIISKPNIKIN